MIQRLRSGLRLNGQRRGFTLVELAIVLGVATLLFGGLWRLMSTGSAQLRDQAAADQQKQLMAAAKAWLAGNEGYNNNLVPMAEGEVRNLPIPAPATACANQNFACYLPNGFDSTTRNAYGQGYVIRYRKDIGAAGTVPQAYSFMVVTSGGENIPDSSGGRISGMIGNDGGFLYAADTCGPPANNMACGAYGGWSLNITTAVPAGYAFGAGTSGHIASRTSVGARSGDAEDVWLARRGRGDIPTYPLVGGVSPEFYTIQHHVYLANPRTANGNDFFLGGNTVFGGSAPATLGGFISNVQAVGIGQTNSNPLDLNFAALAVNGRGTFAIPSGNANATVVINKTGCPNGAKCNSEALYVLGDARLTGEVYATQFYSPKFLYDSDETLKKDISIIDHALDKLAKIRGVSFLFKDDAKNEDGKKHLGVIAQELEKVFPELVHEVNGHKAVDYPSLVGPLIAAVNELRERNDNLAKEVKDLSAKVKSLEAAPKAKK